MCWPQHACCKQDFTDDEMNKLVPFLLGIMVHPKEGALGERRVLKGNYDFHPMDHWVNMDELQRTVRDCWL